ncbi:hypothetical protein AQJ11_39155 [Streptomyces corchorusii]|uniref:Uncharacterized protein n=1 Tax=Streptomyces corchorusii TaxID=1903 RepID=A0A101PRZ3_STRCK|nr:hypothetical protein AQJ11_39155 [Streptomyces corchorusii]
MVVAAQPSPSTESRTGQIANDEFRGLLAEATDLPEFGVEGVRVVSIHRAGMRGEGLQDDLATVRGAGPVHARG